MKNIIFILIMIITTSVFCQEQAKTITVIGETKKQVEIDSIYLTISLNQIKSNEYDKQVEPMTLSQVTQNYRNKLKQENIDFSEFKENIPMHLYQSFSSENDIAYYSYATTSVDMIKNIVKQKVNGVTIMFVEIIAKEKTQDELASLTGEALINAKAVAQKIANKINKKIGAIIKIEDTNSADQYIDYYKLSKPQKHFVNVTFALE